MMGADGYTATMLMRSLIVLLVMVAVLSTFLDNIAAAMIGGAMAHVVYKRKVHIGYLAAIVAASNAGGAGSVGAVALGTVDFGAV